MRTHVRTLLLLTIAIGVSIGAHAADFVTRTYPMSIDVEGRYVQSAIFLRLQVRDYDLPFERFASAAQDPYERAFVSFVNALRDNDTASAAKMLAPERRVAAAATDAQPRMEHSPAEVVRGYRAGFGEMKDITVVAQVL